MENSLDIKVSVLCTVYNHEKYLRKCIESILHQKTSFNFEIIIHDDCSIDSSRQIIEEYYNKYPSIIVPIFEETNQYSKGKRILIDFMVPKIKGKYFALCEGDDYWIDECKLQKQYDFMEENQEYSLCIHNSIVVDVKDKKIRKIITSRRDSDILCEQIILGGGGFLATNSIFAPSYYAKKLPNYFENTSLDYIWQIYLSSQGKTRCFKEFMSAYRTSVPNSWSQRMKKNITMKINFLNQVCDKLKEINKYTKEKYSDSFEKAILLNKIKTYELQNNYKELRKEPYRSFIKSSSAIYNIKYLIKKYFRSFYNFYAELKKY